jgi:CheY-like chemotaxis protein
VAEVVLQRALDHAFGSRGPGPRRSIPVIGGQCRLDRQALPPTVSWCSVQNCFASLIDQWWCLLGSAAGAPLAKTIQTIVEQLHGAANSLPEAREEATAVLTRNCDEGEHCQAEEMKPGHAILLVEDNPADVKITQRALKESGLRVDLIVVRDGQEAVDYLLRQGAHAAAANWRRPELILLDLNLPGMPGREVLQRVRGNPTLRAVPVVVLTTSRRQEDIQEMYSSGANTYIEKPHDFNHFVQVLQTIHRYWLDTALLPPMPSE